MIKRDYHIHTAYSDDCIIPMETMVLSAIEKGMEEIALTDHVDYDYPDRDLPFVVNYDLYSQDYYALKEKYQDKINILFGVEIGLQPHLGSKIEELLAKYPFDFAIGSIHTVKRHDIYARRFWDNKSKVKGYTEYFEDVLECAKMHSCYRVFGHLDYVNRYGGFDDKTLYYKDYADIIDEILKTIIKGERGIEINTSGYRYGLTQTHPQRDILKRYKELGGEIITLGSDSHKAEDISADFDIAEQMLKDLGIHYLTKFSKMKPEMYKIGD
ncbi:histidinol-phosphatase HisJ family protein [Acetoanaerobium noterae]|uniref:histidinol-phosphatase HisJ family protein n=1 Tax=Acetoanaerobium noterae TaxID=745369 RepID=UPI003241E88C